jgi:hypothetical protein
MGATGRFVTLGVAPGNKKRYLDFCIFEVEKRADSLPYW